jgi:hypothetical protein
MIDYKAAYMFTLEQLYFKTRELSERDRREEDNLRVLSELHTLITTFDRSFDTLEGKRKDNALNTIKTLIYVFNSLGKIYLDELATRKKLIQAQKDILMLTEKITTLESELNTLKNIDLL